MVRRTLCRGSIYIHIYLLYTPPIGSLDVPATLSPLRLSEGCQGSASLAPTLVRVCTEGTHTLNRPMSCPTYG